LAAEVAKVGWSIEYTVKQGDTLWGISRKNNLTVAELCRANNLDETKVLSIGTVLIVPIK
jgi:LysM repeat protein